MSTIYFWVGQQDWVSSLLYLDLHWWQLQQTPRSGVPSFTFINYSTLFFSYFPFLWRKARLNPSNIATRSLPKGLWSCRAASISRQGLSFWGSSSGLDKMGRPGMHRKPSKQHETQNVNGNLCFLWIYTSVSESESMFTQLVQHPTHSSPRRHLNQHPYFPPPVYM